MLDNNKTGGPAFPCDLTMYDKEVQVQMQGMTLRDYFAAKALEGLLANPDTAGDLMDFPRWAYTYADEMLRAREAKDD